MKNYIKYILVAGLFCAFANVNILQGQDAEDNRVMVYLDNGSKFEAKLIVWDQDSDTMTFDVFGNEVAFPNKAIKKIVQLNGVGNVVEAYTFKETGPYFHIRTNLITGNPGNRENMEPGIGISVSGGKRFNRLVSVGVGVGFDEFIAGTSENILSTFGEFSGYLFENNQSISYNVAAGYGFAFKDEEVNLTSASGGWMVHPAFGLRWGKKKLKWTFDVGYKFQKANWVYDNWGTISDQRILYRRLTLRTGVMF